MVSASYTPQQGDYVFITLDPPLGHEQKGRRPALVISPTIYNKRTGLFLVCPITTQIKGYPFEVNIPEHNKTHGVILVDAIKSLDWQVRNTTYIDSADLTTMQNVTSKLQSLINISQTSL